MQATIDNRKSKSADFDNESVLEMEEHYQGLAIEKLREFMDRNPPKQMTKELRGIFQLALSSNEVTSYSKELADWFYLICDLEDVFDSLEVFTV